MQTYSVFEYDEVNYEIVDSEEKIKDDTLYLKESSVNYLEEKNIAKVYRKKIKFQNYVGVISFGNITLEILPKFLKIDKHTNSIDNDTKARIYFNLIRMLEFSRWWEWKIREVDHIPFTEKSFLNLFEIFVYFFAKNLYDLLKRVRDSSYIKNFDELRCVKGKIDFKKYLNPAKIHIIPCIYYDRSMNTIINRLLKYVAHLLLKKCKSNENKKYLKEVCSILDPVLTSFVRLGELKNITYNRLNLCFKPYVEFCKTVLKNSVLSYRGSTEKSSIDFFSFLIPMEKLFEKFLGEAFKEVIDELNKNTEKKYRILLQNCCGHLLRKENKKLNELIPDIVIIKRSNTNEDTSEKLIIIDTKYKLIRDETNESEESKALTIYQQDIYQMYVYSKEVNHFFSNKKRRISDTKCILIYPQEINGNMEIKDAYKLGSEKIDLIIRSVSLDNIFEDNQLSLTEAFKETFKQIVES